MAYMYISYKLYIHKRAGAVTMQLFFPANMCKYCFLKGKKTKLNMNSENIKNYHLGKMIKIMCVCMYVG